MFSEGRTAIFGLLLLLVVVSCENGSDDEMEMNFYNSTKELDDLVPQTVKNFNKFDWDFWKVVSNSTDENALISPISVKLGLALLYEGAQDQTADEIGTALYLPATRPATREIFSDILKVLKESSPDYILNVGTRIYIDSSITPRLRYNAIAKNFYDTDVKNANFSVNARSIANDVNDWARNLTQGNIDQLIEEEGRLQDSMLLLASALYFKGTWRNYPFSRDNTIQGNFMTSSAGSVKVDYMKTDSLFYFYHSQKLGAKILRLPYKGQRYAMYLILPDAQNGLDEVIEKVNPLDMNSVVWNMEKVSVDVQIPKFKFEAGSHLEPALRQMGIREVFTDKATLTGFTSDENTNTNLYVSDVIHKAGIEVNEEGTTAFATTEIELGNKNSGMSFYATHPFMFYIEDESSGVILYMGKVNNPAASSGSGMTTRAPQVVASNNNNKINLNTTEANGNQTNVGVGLDDRYNYFNMELVKNLFEEHEGNLILSPASVKAALMTLVEATDGRTQQEILSALRLPANVSIVRSVAHRDLVTLKSSHPDVQLHLASRFWVDKDLPISPDYAAKLKEFYAGDVGTVDFAAVDRTVETINSWVRERTGDRVKSIVDAGNLDPETNLLITSAIHFKSPWRSAFIHQRTRDSCFQTFVKNCRTVPMMESYDNYNYANVPALDAQVLEVPYTDEKYAMLFMLPNKKGKGALDALSRDMPYTPISLLLRNLKSEEVELQLPRFSVENKFELKEALGKIGIKDLFSSANANLTKAFPATNYYVSDVVQNAKIEVTEDGTEAAAVTGLTLVPLMASSAASFRLNRPFLFFVIDKTRSTILFAGKLIEP